MSNIFLTERINSEWLQHSEDLEEYYSLVDRFKFDEAVDKGKKCSEKYEIFEKYLSDAEPDDTFNDFYILRTVLNTLIEYASYWNHVSKKFCSESWSHLQNTQDSLRVLKKFTKADKTEFFQFFQKQCENLEKIYPYNLFASIEAIYKKVECSICGKNMDSFDCPHIRGELYRGKMASGIVTDVAHLCSVSLVTEPQDKRCIISYPEDSPAFNAIHYLSDLLTKRQLNPLKFSHVKFRKIDIPISKFGKMGRNVRCPCGSGKKYKKCCIEKESIEKDHVDIIGLESKGILPNNLVHLT